MDEETIPAACSPVVPAVASRISLFLITTVLAAVERLPIFTEPYAVEELLLSMVQYSSVSFTEPLVNWMVGWLLAGAIFVKRKVSSFPAFPLMVNRLAPLVPDQSGTCSQSCCTADGT